MPRTCIAATVLVYLSLPSASWGQACVGDCDQNGAVAVNELVLGTNIALDRAALTACASFDSSANGKVEVNELVLGVNNLLQACIPIVTPTVTPTATQPAPTNSPGEEFQINTYTTGSGSSPAVAADENGNFVVIWEQGKDGTSQDGDGIGIFGQRLDSSGARLGTEFQVNTSTTGNQEEPAVAIGNNGSFVVVWEVDTDRNFPSEGIFAQRFDSTGTRSGTEFQVNSSTGVVGEEAVIAASPEGDFTVVWEATDALLGQRFDSIGGRLGSEFVITTSTDKSSDHPAIANLQDGGFVVVWDREDPVGSCNSDHFGQRFNSAGTKVGSEFQVNTYTTGAQGEATIASDATGRFIVAWRHGCFGVAEAASGQLFDTAGNRVGGEITVVSETEFDGIDVTFVGTDVVVLLQSCSDEEDGACAHRFDGTGSRIGSEFRVTNFAGGDGDIANAGLLENRFVSVVLGRDGDGRGVFGRIFSLEP